MLNLDHNATSPLSLAALQAMQTVLVDMQDHAGNPSSPHLHGQRARAKLEQARQQILTAIGGAHGKLVLTSGATEANHLAWHGILAKLAQPRVLTTAVEHPSVRAQVARLRQAGAQIVDVPVDAQGRVNLQFFEEQLQQKPHLVSVMAVQNELGVIQPIAQMAALTHAVGALFHTDATQAPGRIPLNLAEMQVDLASFSAHKLGGPPGVGALWLRRGLTLEPLLVGHQEDGLRGGTENLPGIVGMGAAFAEIPQRLAQMQTIRAARDLLWQQLEDRAEIRRNGMVNRQEETGHVLHLAVQGMDGARLVRALDLEGIATSSGAACASGTQAPSHVLLACGQTPTEAREGLRLSLGAQSLAELPNFVPVFLRLLQRFQGLRA